MPISVNHTSQTIGWFNDRLAEGTLIFKPPFQRNHVWKEKHKAYLVDTVIKNLPIPEIYLQQDTDSDGKTTYAIVDGQQRIRALLEFPQNKFSLMGEYTHGRDGATWNDFSSDEKREYWGYKIAVREVSNASDSDLRDIFQRLNRHTVVLNSQELRNARYQGEFLKSMTQLADQDYWAENSIVTANEIRRMLDIEFISELVVGLLFGPQNKKGGIDPAYEKFESDFPEEQKIRTRFENTRKLIEQMLPDIKATRWRGKSDFYSLFLTVDMLSSGQMYATARLEKAGKKLTMFGQNVTKELSKNNQHRSNDPRVRKYATAVEKAASDKDRREERNRVLSIVLGPYFKKSN